MSRVESVPENTNAIWSTVLLEELWRLGVRDVCLAPGSRSAPLAFTVAAHDGLKHHVHFDERGLGFFALGIAKASGAPVAVITTSGTAVANLLPAVIEAHQSNIPLILLTADRPPELIDCAANQAIDQLGIFAGYTGAALNLPSASTELSLRWLLSSVDSGFAQSCARGLPLHINAMFREPLYPHQTGGMTAEKKQQWISSIERWLKSGQPYTSYSHCEPMPLPTVEFAESFFQGHGVVVVGRIPAGSDVEPLLKLAQQVGWPLLTDVQSQLHGDSRTIRYGDLLLTHPEGKTLLQQADRLLLVGGYLTSKRMDQFIAEHPWYNVWMVDESPRRIDSSWTQTHRWQATADVWFEDVHQQLQGHQPFDETVLHGLQAISERLHNGLVNTTPATPTERWVGQQLATLLPEGTALFAGNSLPIRMLDLFTTAPLPCIFASRGASGIDGLLATAVGCALGSAQPLVLLVGDLSFLYDLNSLALVRQLTTPFVVVLMNNDGGGIFYATTKGSEKAVANELFVMPHGLTGEHAAAQFGLQYAVPDSTDAFTEQLAAALQRDGGTIIEVTTPSGEGVQSIAETVAQVATW